MFDLKLLNQYSLVKLHIWLDGELFFVGIDVWSRIFLRSSELDSVLSTTCESIFNFSIIVKPH